MLTLSVPTLIKIGLYDSYYSINSTFSDNSGPQTNIETIIINVYNFIIKYALAVLIMLSVMDM